MKKSQNTLKQEIDTAAEQIVIGSTYTHYKDSAHTYKVLDLAINTEGDEVWVVYQALYGEQVIFLRSVREWCDDVEKDGITMKRFSPVNT